MAWSESSLFRQCLADVLENAAAFDFGSDTYKAALFNNSITPDKNVSAANSAYNVAQWGTANEVFEAGQWAQGGVVLGGQQVNVGTNGVVFFDASDTASGSAADLANAFGCQVYNDTLASPVADQGACYNYFGGGNSVVNGTFTIVWHASGVFRLTLT